MDEKFWRSTAQARKAIMSNPKLSISDRVQAIALDFAQSGRFDNSIKDVKVISVDTKTQIVEFELTIGFHLCSKMGTFHGGAAATFLDDLTSVALSYFQAAKGDNASHVSRTITMTYLRPVLQGQTVRIRCWPVAIGKKTANLYGEVRSLDGKVCVTCIHDKAMIPAPPAFAKL